MDAANALIQTLISIITQEVLKSEPVRLLVKATQDLHAAAAKDNTQSQNKDLLGRVQALEDMLDNPGSFVNRVLGSQTQQLSQMVTELVVAKAVADYLDQNSAEVLDRLKSTVDSYITHSNFRNSVLRALVREETNEWLTDGRNNTIADAVESCLSNGTLLEGAIDKHLKNSDAVGDAVDEHLKNVTLSVSVN